MTVQDRDYIVSSINYMFPELNITADDIESSWAGLRPLIHEEGKDPSEISRKDEIWTSQSGLITIAGGKLTGYRKMAEHIVDLVRDRLKEEGGQDFGGRKTKTMPISGGHVGGSKNFESFVEAKTKDGLKIGLSQETAKQLAIRYGSNVENVFSRIEGLKDEAENARFRFTFWRKRLTASKKKWSRHLPISSSAEREDCSSTSNGCKRIKRP